MRARLDVIKLKVPVFGNLFHKLALARFTRNLSTLLHAGVPILLALEITAETIDNAVISRAVADVRTAVRQGETRGQAAVQPSGLPPDGRADGGRR